MIAGDAFKDLSYVNDDDESLMKIFLISLHCIELNLKFKNESYGNA